LVIKLMRRSFGSRDAAGARNMADKAQTPELPTGDETPATPATPPKRSPGHRGTDVRDAVAEMTARAHEISLEAGSKMASALKDVVNAAAGLAGFAMESARDLVQYMVRRGQMTQEDADKLLRDAEEAQARRKAAGGTVEREVTPGRPEALRAEAPAEPRPKAPVARDADGVTAPPSPPPPVVSSAPARPATTAAPAAPAAAKKPATKEAAKSAGAKAAKQESVKAAPKTAPKAAKSVVKSERPGSGAAKKASLTKSSAKSSAKAQTKKPAGKRR
jgi:hypothetical protein